MVFECCAKSALRMMVGELVGAIDDPSLQRVKIRTRPHPLHIEQLARNASLAFLSAAGVARRAAGSAVDPSGTVQKAHERSQRCSHNASLGRDTFLLTQEFLSMMLGVRRATVTVAAGTLQNAGLIRLSRGTFFIPSHDLLAEAACGCYGVLRRDFEVLRRAELGLPPEGDIEKHPLPWLVNMRRP